MVRLLLHLVRLQKREVRLCPGARFPMSSWHISSGLACWLRSLIGRELGGQVGKRGCGGQCWSREGLHNTDVGIFGLFFTAIGVSGGRENYYERTTAA